MPKVFIVWGTEDTKAASEGEWEELENNPVEYIFETDIEAAAFLKGVDEAIGWMDYFVLDKHLVEVCKREKEKKK
jgi:hypothetical protein